MDFNQKAVLVLLQYYREGNAPVTQPPWFCPPMFGYLAHADSGIAPTYDTGRGQAGDSLPDFLQEMYMARRGRPGESVSGNTRGADDPVGVAMLRT